ncbi:MAD2 mitotic arrest deficient-like 2, partial [Desmophyllum pertusum]
MAVNKYTVYTFNVILRRLVASKQVYVHLDACFYQFVLTVSGGVLCEFLEVAFHLILYVREVYPPVVFERRKKYNVPVQMCCHPDLNQYIVDVLQTTKPLLEK